MPPHRRSLKRLILLASAAVLAAAACGPGGARDHAPPGLADGFYIIARDSTDREAVQPVSSQEILAIHDYRFIADAEDAPPRYLVLPTEPDVPLVLREEPGSLPQDDGRILLLLTLADAHVEELARLTRENIGRGVAIVVGGDVVTTHAIRSVIEDGRIQISRCSDDGCRVLLARLSGRAR